MIQNHIDTRTHRAVAKALKKDEVIFELKIALILMRARYLEIIWRHKRRTLKNYPSAYWAETEMSMATTHMACSNDSLPPKLREEIRREAAAHFRRWYLWLKHHEAKERTPLSDSQSQSAGDEKEAA